MSRERLQVFTHEVIETRARGLCRSSGLSVEAFAQRLYPIPPQVRASNTFRSAFVIASGAWLCGHALRGGLRLWLVSLHRAGLLSLELYLIADTVVGWPINISLVAFTTWYPLRQLRRAGFMSLVPVPIRALDAIELAVEETAPTTV